MQIQTIRFSANNQSLTGGGGCFASSTVSYIKALFDLGENWTGWTVSAIWRSRYQHIATVLEDGACMVPAEVLESPGQVFVNLVASETENNVVVERLTTSPVLALVVDARALVNGTETTEITPSQFEQFVAAVEDYSQQAIDARDRSENAAEAAELAQGKAEAAQEKAETAQGLAEDAQGFAEEAATAAGNSAADADRSEGEAAAWATGSYSGDGGIPVPSTAPQHHNNAKYYSNLAAQSAAQSGYMWFEIIDGDLYIDKTENVEVEFSLVNGDLYVSA